MLAEARADTGEEKRATDHGDGEQNTEEEEPNLLASKEPNQPEQEGQRRKKKKKKRQRATDAAQAAGDEALAEPTCEAKAAELYAGFLSQSHAERRDGAYATSVWAIPLATAEPEDDDYDRAQNERLHNAFWYFADVADPWLPTRSQGLETWQQLLTTGYDTDYHDQQMPFLVFDGVERFVNDVVEQPRASSLLAEYAGYLNNYTVMGGNLIPFDDEAAWKSAVFCA